MRQYHSMAPASQSSSPTEPPSSTPIGQKKNTDAVLSPMPAARKPRRSDEEKLEKMMETLRALNWTISKFLYTLFRFEDDAGQPIRLDKSLETSLSHFLCGRADYPPVKIVDLWLRHPFSNPSTTVKTHEPLFSVDTLYITMKHTKPAITLMAAQLMKNEMHHEQH